MEFFVKHNVANPAMPDSFFAFEESDIYFFHLLYFIHHIWKALINK